MSDLMSIVNRSVNKIYNINRNILTLPVTKISLYCYYETYFDMTIYFKDLEVQSLSFEQLSESTIYNILYSLFEL